MPIEKKELKKGNFFDMLEKQNNVLIS